MHVLTAGIPGFKLRIMYKENKDMPPLEFHLVEEGLLPTLSIAMKYFKTENKIINTSFINSVVAASKSSVYSG